MKKLLFVITLLMLVPSGILAEDGTTAVEMKGATASSHNRGELLLPVVTYSSINGSFTIEFESEDSYVLEVEDINGINWYSGPVNTSGSPTVYYVNLQSNNTYYITISSDNDSFYGVLIL